MTYVFVNVRFPEEKSRGNGTKSVNNVRELVVFLRQHNPPPSDQANAQKQKKIHKKTKNPHRILHPLGLFLASMSFDPGDASIVASAVCEPTVRRSQPLNLPSDFFRLLHGAIGITLRSSG